MAALQVINTSLLASPGELDSDAGTLTIRSRLLGDVELSPAMAAKVVMVTLADYLDQMATVNGWTTNTSSSRQENATGRQTL